MSDGVFSSVVYAFSSSFMKRRERPAQMTSQNAHTPFVGTGWDGKIVES